MTYEDYAALPDVEGTRYEMVTRRGIEGAPDLVLEILSPTSIKRGRLGKLKSYAQHGIPEFWIVDSSGRSLERYLLRESAYELVNVFTGDDTVHSDRLPCVSFTMNDVLS